MRTDWVDGDDWDAAVVNDLAEELNAKSDDTHTHLAADITDGPASGLIAAPPTPKL
jgi:Phage tail repeat like